MNWKSLIVVGALLSSCNLKTVDDYSFEKGVVVMDRLDTLKNSYSIAIRNERDNSLYVAKVIDYPSIISKRSLDSLVNPSDTVLFKPGVGIFKTLMSKLPSNEPFFNQIYANNIKSQTK